MSEWRIQTAVVTVDDPASLLAAIRGIAEANATHIVLFDRDRMAGRSHVASAIAHAARACREGRMIARTFEMEALLYAAGSRQITVGRTFGIHQGENRCYLCLYPDVPEAWTALAGHLTVTDDQEEGITPQKRERLMELFSISSAEVMVVGEERLDELVLERVALLEVYR